jgi:hypothetical protein
MKKRDHDKDFCANGTGEGSIASLSERIVFRSIILAATRPPDLSRNPLEAKMQRAAEDSFTFGDAPSRF